jgi:hypothetical protein
MVKVKSAQARADAYRRAIPTVTAAYKAGVESTSGWQAAAIDGQGLYEQRMQDSEVLSRRAKNLAKVSDADWKTAASIKGSQRIAAGMEQGAAKQVANWAPYGAALESLTLPGRTADGVQNVQNRVIPVVQRMMDTKKQVG